VEDGQPIRRGARTPNDSGALMSPSARLRQPRAVALLVGGGLLILLTSGCHGNRPVAAVAPDLERVNIGYGSRAARDATGSIASTRHDKAADARVGRVEEMLEGRFAGLDVVRDRTGGHVLRIRGGRGEPLIVIDGIPSPLGLPSPLSDIAPGMVAAVSVLKDAGSTAVYGSRGANGVILITTRRTK
jgi:TonB-dependent SusC/RagA subfamily outer membrane receptor